MNLDKIVKLVSIASTVVGMVTTVATAWADSKKMDIKIEEEVDKAVAKRLNEDES